MSESSQIDIERLAILVQELDGKPCWRAYTSFNSPALHFGRKIERPGADAMKRSERWRNRPESWWHGEFRLIVWCSWRLDADAAPITSSDDSSEKSFDGIQRLIGAWAVNTTVFSPAGDLDIEFNNRLRLRIFCDHVPGEPSFHGNWELGVPRAHVMVGPGALWTFKSV